MPRFAGTPVDEPKKPRFAGNPVEQEVSADDYGKGFFAQATSGINEGIATALGMPIDLANAAVGLGMKGINAVAGTNLRPSDEPLGGSAGLKRSLEEIGAIRPETDDRGKHFVRRIGQEVGAAVVPGLGTIGKAQAPAREAAKLLATAVGSGTGAATADVVAPDNPYAEMAGQVLGGLAVGAPIALAGRSSANRAAKAAVPSIDELRASKDAAYKTVDDMGVTYKPEAVAELNQGIKDSLSAAEIDDVLNPRATRAASILDKRFTDNAQTLSDLDRARQFISNNVVDAPGQKIEGRFAGIMKDNIDEFIDAATPDQIVAGNPEAAASTIKSARKLNTQVKKYEQIADALNVAEHKTGSTYSGGNIDNASRQAIRSILDNPKKSRAYSDIEKAMMERIVMGTKGQNVARQIGKLSPSGNGLQQALALGATAYNPVMGVLPGAGAFAKGMADRATSKNVDSLLTSILAGGPVKKAPLLDESAKRIVAAMLAAQAANATAH